MKEEWRDVIGYEGYYQVSNHGQIRSIFTKYVDKNGKTFKHKPKILKQSIGSTGYYFANLFHKSKKTHILVAKAFIPLILGKYFINHKDLNKLNNNVENLEWCSMKENINHAVLNHACKSRGNYNKNEILDLYKNGETAKNISKILNITKQIVQNVVAKNKINRNLYQRKSKYGISLNKLKEELLKHSNKHLSIFYNCPPTYIARRRYQFKKGVI